MRKSGRRRARGCARLRDSVVDKHQRTLTLLTALAQAMMSVVERDHNREAQGHERLRVLDAVAACGGGETPSAQRGCD